LDLITAPETEPVSLAEAKLHCRIEQTADDDYVTALIEGARQLVERITRRALITQTWTLTLDRWAGHTRDDWWDGMREGPISMVDACDEVELRKAPFQSLTSVETVDEDGTKTAWDESNYYSTTRQGWGMLVKRVGQIWPLIVPPVRQRGGILITFDAGYGDVAADVPIALRQAIKDIVLHWYEVREAVGETSRWHPPLKTAAILQQYTVGR
jgi:hypothetical protein